jgi:hypothetical protein
VPYHFSYSPYQTMNEVPRDRSGTNKAASSTDGLPDGLAAQIVGNSRDARESAALGRHVADIEAWTVEKAKRGQVEAIKFQARVLKALAPAGDAVNVGGLALGIQTKIVDYFDEVSPGVFVFRLADFLAEIEAIRCFRG